MSICHVNLASGFSGGERQTLALIKHQLSIGYNLTVVVNPEGPLLNELKPLDCQVITAKNYLFAHKKQSSENCRLIHVHEGRAIYWALIQSKLFNIPYIITRRIDNTLSNKWLSRLAYSNASALIGLSRKIVSLLSEKYRNSEIYVIPSSPILYPINPQKIANLENQFNGKFVVIQAANMLKHKGFAVSVEAASILSKTHPNIHFVFLGDGKERALLESRASALSNITFAGKQSDMGSWFEFADLFIHPSYSEGLGSVILEAIVAGLPVIGSDVGGIPDIIEHEKNGLLIEPGEPKALVKAILKMYEDKTAVARYKKNNEVKLKEFSIASSAKKYQQLYNNL